MRALVKYAVGAGNAELQEVAERPLGPDDVRIRVEVCGICGTDIHIYRTENYPYKPPKIMGHEFSGVVEAIGPAVKSVRIGDRATGIPIGGICGRCRYCLQGHYFQCPERKTFGTGVNGGFANYVTVKDLFVRRLPDNVSFTAGALIEPLACCVKAVSYMTDISASEVVLVIGPGPIGLLAMQIAKAEGAFVVLAGMDVDVDRLAMGGRLGADLLVNASKEDLKGALAAVTGGLGPDVVLECSGTPGGTRAGLQVIAGEGRFTQIGLHEVDVTLDVLNLMLMKDIRFRASYASSAQGWDRAIALVAQGKVQLEPLVSHTLPMTDWRRGFDLIEARQALKVLLKPNA